MDSKQASPIVTIGIPYKMTNFQFRVSPSSGGVVGPSAACRVSLQSSVFLCVSIRFQRCTTHFEVHIDENPYFWVDFSKSVSTVMTSPFKLHEKHEKNVSRKSRFQLISKPFNIIFLASSDFYIVIFL